MATIIDYDTTSSRTATLTVSPSTGDGGPNQQGSGQTSEARSAAPSVFAQSGSADEERAQISSDSSDLSFQTAAAQSPTQVPPVVTPVAPQIFMGDSSDDGYSEEAGIIADRSKETAFKDFREFYSPETGRGMRGTKFGWATAAVAIDA